MNDKNSKNKNEQLTLDLDFDTSNLVDLTDDTLIIGDLGNVYSYSGSYSGSFSLGGLFTTTASPYSNITITPLSSGYSTLGGTTYDIVDSAYPFGNIKLGENQDIQIGEKSLKDFMKQVSERLEIFTPNQELEKEFESLKKLGDEYRSLETELKEKMKTWNILSK